MVHGFLALDVGEKDIFQQYLNALVDEIIDVSQDDAENTTVQLAKKSGLFCGISSGANIFISRQISNETEKSCIVTIICDRGDRYLSKI